MCLEYYRLRQQLLEICRRELTFDGDLRALDDMALAEIKTKMDVHIKNCKVCQENMAWMRGEK